VDSTAPRLPTGRTGHLGRRDANIVA
jgi:hypothetical protein